MKADSIFRIAASIVAFCVGSAVIRGDSELVPSSQPSSRPAGGGQDTIKALTPEELFAKVSPAVVKVYVFDKDSKPIGQGSGFVVSEDGLLVTNYHVIAKAVSAEVLFLKGDKLPVEGLAASLPEQDLALLKVKGSQIHFLRLAAGEMKIGAKIFAIGSPKGLTNTISEGLLSGYREIRPGFNLIQTTTAISQGSSGGPLVAPAGEVIGVTTLSWPAGQNLNFAIPAKYILALMNLAGKPAPLAEARPDGEPKQVRGSGDVFTSFEEILSVAPKELLPQNQKPPQWTELTAGLFEVWSDKNLAGKNLMLRGVQWREARLQARILIPRRSGQSTWPKVEGRTVSTRTDFIEPSGDGMVYNLMVTFYFEPDVGKDLVTFRAGDLVDVSGQIARIFLSPGSRQKHKAIDAYVMIYMLNCRATVSEKQQKAVPVIKLPPPSTRPAPREMTPEQKAAARLQLARTYIASGMRPLAADILRSILTDYPGTTPAREAEADLRDLSPAQ